MGILFKGVLLLLAGLLACFLMGQVFRSMRRLDRRVAEFKAEQRALEEQGRTPHPYVALAELYAEEEATGKNYKAAPKINPRSGRKIRRIRRKGG